MSLDHILASPHNLPPAGEGSKEGVMALKEHYGWENSAAFLGQEGHSKRLRDDWSP